MADSGFFPLILDLWEGELIPNANHNPDAHHMFAAVTIACLCLILHEKMPQQKATDCSRGWEVAS